MGNGEEMPVSYRAEGTILICLWFAQPTYVIAAYANSPAMQVELGLLLSLFYR